MAGLSGGPKLPTSGSGQALDFRFPPRCGLQRARYLYGMETEADAWRAFTQLGADTLSKFQRNDISMTETFRFFEAKSDLIADKEAVQSILDTVSEIDGFPRHYSELISLLTSDPSRDALIGWLKF